uniref:Uncharacterized protein n=1 Tax=Pristionchus pacificus TaxID=54126 RepID=A0A2A6B3Z4_PRIPA|eukprot:PDM60581.1 hypothetical protein PRIPAC_53559 [Pristionchus pacificus]
MDALARVDTDLGLPPFPAADLPRVPVFLSLLCGSRLIIPWQGMRTGKMERSNDQAGESGSVRKGNEKGLMGSVGSAASESSFLNGLGAGPAWRSEIKEQRSKINSRELSLAALPSLARKEPSYSLSGQRGEKAYNV